MTTENDLVQRLADAQRAAASSVDQAAFAAVDRQGAYRIQTATMAALGVTPAMFKVAIAPDKIGSIAPIYAGRVGDSGKLQLKSSSVTGLEVEIGMELKSDLPAGADRAAVFAAIGRYFLGMEICGTRYAERTKAVYDAGLADNMSALGYAIATTNWETSIDVDGSEIDLTFNGETIFKGPAKQGFGGVLEALVAYAALPEQPYPLKAGTLITTGSLCGMVPVKGAGKGVARMGGQAVEVKLV